MLHGHTCIYTMQMYLIIVLNLFSISIILHVGDVQHVQWDFESKIIACVMHSCMWAVDYMLTCLLSVGMLSYDSRKPPTHYAYTMSYVFNFTLRIIT